jgi:hypothetical protein
MALARIAAVATTALALLAATAATASAGTATTTDVRVAGADISCFAVQGKSREIECFADFIDTGELDGYIGLRPRGQARRSERGDYPGFGGKRRTLRRGDVWVRPGITCVAGRKRIVCRNDDGHGFRLQEGRTILF